MNDVSIYAGHRTNLEQVRWKIMSWIDEIRGQIREDTGTDPVEHCLSRVKSEESMRAKCRLRGLPETTDSALHQIYDAVGVRAVCAFLDDVYLIRDRLLANPEVHVAQEKDYIKHAKPNGYRSLHLILLVDGYYAEVQLRTISMDTWAALEHNMRYKKDIDPSHAALIESELKRCADELASTDVSMQTLRNLIEGDLT